MLGEQFVSFCTGNKQHNNNNNSSLVYEAPYGRNFRGTGGTADRFS